MTTPPATQSGQGQAPVPATVYDAEYVSGLRTEAANNRVKRNEAQVALREERGGRAVERTAVKLGLDPELAATLLPASKLEFDKDDKVTTDLEAALNGLLTKWPQLKSSAVAGGPGGEVNPMNPPKSGVTTVTKAPETVQPGVNRLQWAYENSPSSKTSRAQTT